VSEIVGNGKQDTPIICRTVAKLGRHFRVLGERARRSPFLDFLARDDKGTIVLVESLENISTGSLHVDDDCTMHQWQWYPRDPRYGRENGSTRGQTQKLSSVGEFHGALLFSRRFLTRLIPRDNATLSPRRFVNCPPWAPTLPLQ
jgi:hypothetical protein